ncbi:MAG: ABC transporter substrate-binding protein [Coriobacteriales bacterium]|jgi:NitT/TauT family transport system substrate-binding protein|nr:ABC transporter substrate-binding protein [Coriobacteriales bacterium]
MTVQKTVSSKGTGQKRLALALAALLALTLSLLLVACSPPPAAEDDGPATPGADAGSGTDAADDDAAGAGPGADASAGEEEFPLGATQIQALGGGLCGSPSYIAKELGFWEEEGIDVELVSGTFQQQKDGLASGQFLVTNGDFQFFPAVNEGLDIKVIGGLHEGCIKLLVPGDSPIQSVADLKGKTIGVDEVGGTPWAVTSVALAEADIDPGAEAGEVTWAPYDLTVLEEVAARGEVDAIAAWDPFGTQAEKDGFRVLVDIGSGNLFGGRYCCFLYASNQGIQESPEKIEALLRGWYRAVEWIAENPEEAADIVTDASAHEAYVASDDKALLVELLGSYKYHGSHDTANSVTAPYEDVLYFADKLKNTGYLPADLDAQQFVDKLWAEVDWQK